MSTVMPTGTRLGETREDLEPIGSEAAFVPGRARGADARALLARDGAVLLDGLPPVDDSLVLAAAEMLGTRLAQVYPVRERGADRGDHIQLHNDSHHIAVDVHGRTTRLRDPDEDYVFLQVVRQAPSGGASVMVDAYRVIDTIGDACPELAEFLTTVDVDYYGAWDPHRGVPPTPQLCRHVEWTRAGRRIVRANQGARPVWRGVGVHEPWARRQEAMLDLYADLRATIAAGAPRFTPREGDVLVTDNYRCWHGRDPHDGPRLVNIMTVRTVDAM